MSDQVQFLRSQSTEEARQKRVSQLRDLKQKKLPSLSIAGIDAQSVRGNIENYIGTIAIPLGLVGPLLIQFQKKSEPTFHVNSKNKIDLNKEFKLENQSEIVSSKKLLNSSVQNSEIPAELVSEKIVAPFATTEGALVSSINRGALAISLSGGVIVRTLHNRMSRAPQFEFNSLDESLLFSNWIKKQFSTLQKEVLKRSGHAQLIEIDTKIMARTVHVRFIYDTGDAAGQNMTTFVTSNLCSWILKEFASQTGIECIDQIIEGNLSSDKKVSWLTAIEGRGRSVMAEAVISAKVLRRLLRLTPEEVVNRFQRSKSARIFSGTIGFNINVANVIAGLFLATGQDMACVHECSLAEFHVEQKGDDLYICLYLPSLIVGTVGGGVGLPGARDNLNLMDCIGSGSANRLAEIIGSFCLALELSTMCAVGSGSFVSAHENLARNRMPNWLRAQDFDSAFFQKQILNLNDKDIIETKPILGLETQDGYLIDLAFPVTKRFCGLFAYHLKIKDQLDQRIFVKIKPRDQEIIGGSSKILMALDPELASIFDRYATYLPFKNCHWRELELMKNPHPVMLPMVPQFLGSYANEDKDAFILIEEYLENLSLSHLINKNEFWNLDLQKISLKNISAIHGALWEKKEQALNRWPHLFDHYKSESFNKSRPLWEALFEFSKQVCHHSQKELIFDFYWDALDDSKTTWSEIDRIPKTLIHFDFNPRNLAFRKDHQLVLFDWEFAAWGPAQRDGIEFLLFTLEPNFQLSQLRELIDFHRLEIEKVSLITLDSREWLKGYRHCLHEFVIQRLPFYFIISQSTQCLYLERVLDVLARIALFERELFT